MFAVAVGVVVELSFQTDTGVQRRPMHPSFVRTNLVVGELAGNTQTIPNGPMLHGRRSVKLAEYTSEVTVLVPKCSGRPSVVMGVAIVRTWCRRRPKEAAPPIKIMLPSSVNQTSALLDRDHVCRHTISGAAPIDSRSPILMPMSIGTRNAKTRESFDN